MNSNLRDVRGSLQEVLLEVKQRPTRQEIEAMVSTRVSSDIFNAELKSVRDDIVEMRQKPENFRSWISTVVAVGGCAITLISIVISTLISIAMIVLPHWK